MLREVEVANVLRTLLTASRHHLLIADDDEDDRLIIDEAFESVSIPTRREFVDDGQALLDAMHAESDLSDTVVLLDLNMPRMNGLDTLHAIRANSRFRRVPVVVLTTSSASHDVDLAYEGGANTYFVKPNSFAGLTTLAKEIVQYWFMCASLPQPEAS